MRASISALRFLVALGFIWGLGSFTGPDVGAQETDSGVSASAVEVDAHAPARPFPHFWERMFGSGRAILALREGYRRDLREVKRITGFEYVRFHAIFHDEVGVYDEDAKGNPVFNFSYVDQIYDGLLENGVRPFVEIGFMPSKLSSDQGALHAFWYRPNVAPPKDWQRWEDLIEAFARHLVERYGEDEVAQWYFEVWNEPSFFLIASDLEATYFALYEHTARALKRVSTRLRVGGPATAQAGWVDRFLAHCAARKVPVDFVSTHVYGSDSPANVLGTDARVPRNGLVCGAVKKVREQIAASEFPDAPLMFTEFNAVSFNDPAVTDSPFMGPWLADTIARCDGLAEMMSFWTFSDVFEEGGVVREPFWGGFGLLAAGGIPKPSFNAFALLHELGDARLDVASDSVLVTRRKDGSLAVAAWNLVLPGEAAVPKRITLRFAGLSGKPAARIQMVDPERGSPWPAYDAMGRPKSPTPMQVNTLREAAALPEAVSEPLADGSLTLTLGPHALALVTIQ